MGTQRPGGPQTPVNPLRPVRLARCRWTQARQGVHVHSKASQNHLRWLLNRCGAGFSSLFSPARCRSYTRGRSFFNEQLCTQVKMGLTVVIRNDPRLLVAERFLCFSGKISSQTPPPLSIGKHLRVRVIGVDNGIRFVDRLDLTLGCTALRRPTSFTLLGNLASLKRSTGCGRHDV